MLGKLLGNRYEIFEKIGEGGMARVYKGIDRRLNRYVAIKILYEQFVNDPEFLRRFKQEAKASAMLSHSSIVNVYDEGEEEGIHFIVMEYVQGDTLKSLIQQQGCLKAEEAVRLVLQICDALVHAHRENVIHRDIKPQNIIITPDGRVKVTDFGIARAAADATITHGRSLLGSVHYSSPEQARGSCADQKSDIYSLGVVLYELLTGSVPFSGESPISVALKHLQEDIVPPGELNPELPQELDKIVMKTLHKDRNLRYPGALELKDDLQEWLESREEVDYRERKGRSFYAPPGNSFAEDDEEREEVKKRRFKLKKMLFYTGILAAVLLLFWGGFALLRGILIVPEVPVPDVRNFSTQEAQNKLSEAGLGFKIAGEQHDEKVPPGHVISQDPPAERSVRQKRVVEVIVSLGPDFAEVPSLVGRSELEARLMLRDVGLEMDVSSEYNEEIAPGYVIRQDPSQNFQLSKGETVSVIISSGKKPFSLREFKDWSLEDAQEWLTLYGLVLRNVEEEDSPDIPEGHIISQFPLAGEMVQSGDPVDLVVSKGREPGNHKTYSIQVHPQVSIGQVIKVIVEDEEGSRVVYEGAYHGQVIDVKGTGSGYVSLMELRDNEYYTIDTKQFP